MRSLMHRLARLEERVLPKRNIGAEVAEILRRRRPGEPLPPPSTDEELARTELGRNTLRAQQRAGLRPMPEQEREEHYAWLRARGAGWMVEDAERRRREREERTG